MDKPTDEGSRPDRQGELEAYDQFVRDNLKRNYAGHFIHGMLGLTGFRLVSTPTFVPAYLYSISGSEFWVGIGASLQQLGAVVSPVLGATQIEHRPRVLRAALALGFLMRLQILGLAICGWLFTGSIALGFALLFLFLLGFFQGPQRVAFQFLLAKVIPTSMRGRLQAWRNVTGGLIAAALSYVAGEQLVASHAFGNGYATTFFLAFVLTSLGLSALRLVMREPDMPSVRSKIGVRERMRQLPQLVMSDRGFAWFMLARSFTMGGRIGQPFFVLFAAARLGVSVQEGGAEFGAALAVLSLAFMLADTLSNVVWGYLSDHHGFRSTLIASTCLNIVGVVVLMASTSLPSLVLAFAAIGAAQSGYQMSTTNIVFEFGDRRDAPMRMALSTTAEGAAGAVAPLIGAGLVVMGGQLASFVASIIALAFSLLILVWKVDEPRRRRSAG